jgi:hypothetical protein
VPSKHEWHWTFGDRCHIRFPGGGDPIADSAHGFTSREGCATISDSGGNLLFYTDGRLLYDAADTVINPSPQPELGGGNSSTHSVIIVPPAGGGLRYHIFAVHDWDDSQSRVGPITYTAVTVNGGVSIVSPPTQLTFGPQRAAEKLAAIPHVDCDKYWVVSLDISPGLPGAGTFYAMLIDSDAGPDGTATKTKSVAYPHTATWGFCTKFSPDGTLLAMSSMEAVDILKFNRSTGAISTHSQISNCIGNDQAYGVEFSPNGQYLYFTGIYTGYINRHLIGPSVSFAATEAIAQWTQVVTNACVGALQLAPNGKIYGAKVGENTLFEIGDPDNSQATAVKFKLDATQADGDKLELQGPGILGLPTFTRITKDCIRDSGNGQPDRCAALAAEVDKQLAGAPKSNPLRPCDDQQPLDKPECHPLEVPPIAPWTSIRWGDSKWDCIEGDDTEVMSLTVCNPYRNLTLSNLTIHQIVVVQANGGPGANLPDGTPSVQLVPVGPYCFNDLAPCTCVTRQFVLRLRGAVPGSYRILLRGICFDACFHGDEEDCFIFNVCKD